MGAVILIGLLLLAVAHAGSKVITLEAEVKAANGNSSLPPDQSVAPIGATPTPSPATALGSPSAAGHQETLYNTNSVWALPLPAFYVVGLEQAGLQGVPLPMVPGSQFNGYNAVPARTKQLSTRSATGVPSTTQAPVQTSSGDVVYTPKL